MDYSIKYSSLKESQVRIYDTIFLEKLKNTYNYLTDVKFETLIWCKNLHKCKLRDGVEKQKTFDIINLNSRLREKQKGENCL